MTKRVNAVRLFSAVCLGLFMPVSAKPASLELVTNNWGTNGVPSTVTMYVYVPDKLAAKPPILVVCHYCGGTAAGVFGEASGGGIVSACNQYGFIMIFPQAANPDGSGRCWDVGSTKALTRDGGGDTQAIANMVNYAITNYQANGDRVYVTGTSSGAMMTEALLALYPDVFKAGAEFSGVPAGCWAVADPSGGWSVPCASGQVVYTPQEWGAIVRAMYQGYSGARPRIQLWHGTADTTISYTNQTEGIKEWTDVLGLSLSPTVTTTVTLPNSTNKWTHQIWQDPCGNALLDAWSEQNGPHGTDANLNAQYVIPFLGLDQAGPVDPVATCGAPGDLVATPVSTNEISLQWNALTNAASYSVKRSTTNGGPYIVIASGLAGTSYLDNGLPSGTEYYYTVSAMVFTNETPDSLQASAATLAPMILLGHWLAGAANLGETSGYSPAGTLDGFAVANGSHYFTNDVPPNARGVSLYLGNSGVGISNTCRAWDPHYTNMFDNPITNSFTVMCWAKGWPAGWNPWISKFGESESGWQLRKDGSTSSYACWTVRNGSVGAVTLGSAVYGNPDDLATRSITVGNDGKWHHYAGTFDANLGVRCLYVDGDLAASETGNAPCIMAANNRLMLGAKDSGSASSSAGGYGSYFTGNLFDVRIYNIALLQPQIRSIAGLTPPSPTSRLSSGNQVVLTWTWGTLLEATNLMGPWTPVFAASPYTNTQTGAELFFRVSNP